VDSDIDLFIGYYSYAKLVDTVVATPPIEAAQTRCAIVVGHALGVLRHHGMTEIGLFCSSAVLDPRVGHTMDVLSPFIPVLCHSD